MFPGTDVPAMLRRGVRHGFRMFLRERTRGATFLAFLSVALLLQCLVLALFATHGVRQVLMDRMLLSVELHPQAADRDVRELYAALRALPVVATVDYLRSDGTDLLSVALLSPRYLNSLHGFLDQPQWKGVVQPSFDAVVDEAGQRIRALLLVVRGVQALLLTLIVLTLAVLFMAIATLVRRTAGYREEAELLELLGASRADVALPVAASMLFPVLPALLLAGLFALLIWFVLSLLPWAALSEGPALLLRREMQSLLPKVGPAALLLELILTSVVAVAGSWVATMRKG